MDNAGTTQTIEDLDEAIYLEEQAVVLGHRALYLELVEIVRAGWVATLADVLDILHKTGGDAAEDFICDLDDASEYGEPATLAIETIEANYSI